MNGAVGGAVHQTARCQIAQSEKLRKPETRRVKISRIFLYFARR